IETASWEGGWTDLFGPTDILTTELAVDDWKEYTFSVTPAFEWDGTSNIMVDISRDDDTDFSPWGAIYKRGNVGTNRMFAGACSNCTFDDLSLYQQIYGNLGSGLSYNYCPSIKLSYIPGNATEIDPFTAVPAEVTIGSTVNLSATLTYSNGTQIANEIILFRDEFDEDIGSVITNGSGVAQINYLVPSIFGATTLTFKAIYVGNTARNLLSSEKTVTINFIASP
ncbi:hypothetical protein KJ786_03675, partial [Patescibacteria group bacterium]|nr:hypothetical protein [Patescibacteria group bacterium]